MTQHTKYFLLPVIEQQNGLYSYFYHIHYKLRQMQCLYRLVHTVLNPLCLFSILFCASFCHWFITYGSISFQWCPSMGWLKKKIEGIQTACDGNWKFLQFILFLCYTIFVQIIMHLKNHGVTTVRFVLNNLPMLFQLKNATQTSACFWWMQKKKSRQLNFEQNQII